MWSLLLLSVLHVLQVHADYDCLCNYGDQLLVFQQSFVDGATVGSLNQFECRPIINESSLLSGVFAIRIQAQKGYVLSTNETKVEQCSGDGLVTGTNPFSLIAHTIPVQVTSEVPIVLTDAPTLPPTTPPPMTTMISIPEGHLNICPSHMLTDARQHNGFIGQFGNYCYELVNTLDVWANAEHHCRATSSSGHLLHIMSQEEQDFVTRFLSGHNYIQSLWTGLNDRYHEGVFEWTSGEKVTYVHTGVQFNTNNHHSSDDCFLFQQGGDWSDVPCGTSFILGIGLGEQHPYICQYKVTSKPPGLFSQLANILIG